MTLTADRLCKSFGGHHILRDVSFRVQSGETLAIIGRSGCGKTTLLRILAGFLPPDGGTVYLDGEKAGPPCSDRLMIFQSFDQLFPWLTLGQNIQYALKKTRPGLSKSLVRETAAHCLLEMDLMEAGDKYPYQLSGGMKQRGAMARAMAIAPKVLLLDEPFSSLDVHLRDKARQSLLALKRETGAAVVIVTHDIGEAVELSTHIAVMTPESRGIHMLMENAGSGVTEKLNRALEAPPGIP